MKFIADLHIHSKYSRATSKNMVLEELDRWADDKGILVMGTGDFTHPGWFKEIKEKLEPAESGLFKLKPQHKKETMKGTLAETRFILSVEISCIYSKNNKIRRIHNIVLAPDIETVEKINTQLAWIGNIASDGRPILGLDSEELAKIVFNINPEAVIVPSHMFTPWFSLFGSMSGFDSIEECFGEYSKYIFVGETGLSADPLMCWRMSQLDNIAFISNSDSHSLEKIGREANIFDTELSYAGIINAIKAGIPASPTNADKQPIYANKNKELASISQNRHKSTFLATIEFFPEEGKYHYDGHRLCGIFLSPEETKKHKGVCPKCGKPLTIGVMNRVEELADRPPVKETRKGFYHSYDNRVPYYNLVSLDKIIADAFGMSITAKKVKEEYKNLIKAFGNEIKILMEINMEELSAVADSKIVEGIKRVRESNKIKIRPGYDGEYGEIKIFTEEEQRELEKQKSLF